MIELNKVSFEDYQYEQIANTVKQYQKIRNSLEYSVSTLDKVGKSGSMTVKEELLCILVDIDQGIKYLTPRQQEVILLIKEGYQYDEISKTLGINNFTVASHACQAFERLTDYLNKNKHSNHSKTNLKPPKEVNR